MDKPICVCEAEMEFFMDNKVKDMHQCPACGRLLLRFKGLDCERWFRPDIALQCLRCGWTWRQRGDKLPKVCPNPRCKSPYWNRPRKAAVK